MKTLAFDTSTMFTTIALLNGEKIHLSYGIEGQEVHSEILVEVIEESMRHLDFKMDEIDLIAVGIGPGSFTGLRIAVSAAKVLAQVLDIPVLGISSIEALGQNGKIPGTVIPLLDARRHRVYTARFKREKNGPLIRQGEDTVLNIDEVIARLKDESSLTFLGQGLTVYGEELKEAFPEAFFLDGLDNNLSAVAIGKLAQRAYKAGARDNLYELVPNYLRESQAMRQYRKEHQK